ncbi:hypothetical protein NKH77_00270 [Streptomyces sp. M19]
MTPADVRDTPDDTQLPNFSTTTLRGGDAAGQQLTAELLGRYSFRSSTPVDGGLRRCATGCRRSRRGRRPL